MKITVEENEDGQGFIVFDPEETDEPDLTEKVLEILLSDRFVFNIEYDKLVLYTQPDNIDLGYN